MAADLRELRARITIETDAVLDAMAAVLDKERAEIVRDVLHKWAEQQVAIATLTHKRLRAEGVSVAQEGGSAAREGERR